MPYRMKSSGMRGMAGKKRRAKFIVYIERYKVTAARVKMFIHRASACVLYTSIRNNENFFHSQTEAVTATKPYYSKGEGKFGSA